MKEQITIYDVPADKLNEKLAEALSQIQEFKMPEWAGFVKSGVSRKRPPQEEDWWYKRAASILRQLHIKGVCGVNKFRITYGKKQNRGKKPEKFKKSSGKVIRVILQQAEQADFVKKSKGKRKGRELTKQGLEFLNSISEKVESENKDKTGN